MDSVKIAPGYVRGSGVAALVYCLGLSLRWVTYGGSVLLVLGSQGAIAQESLPTQPDCSTIPNWNPPFYALPSSQTFCAFNAYDGYLSPEGDSMALFISTEGGNSSTSGEFQRWVDVPPRAAYVNAYYDQPRFRSGSECYADLTIVNYDTGDYEIIALLGEGSAAGLEHKRFDFEFPDWPHPYRGRFILWVWRTQLGIPECNVSVTYDDMFRALGMISTSAEIEVPYGDPVRMTAPHPNPATSTSTFDLILNRPEQVRVAVYDQLGREVEVVHDGLMPAGATSLSLITTGFRAGVYVIRATGEGGWTEIQRFTRQG